MASSSEMSFYVVEKDENGSTHDTDYMEADGSAFGDAPRCEVCGYPLASRKWLKPFQVELKLYGREWGDFAFFGPESFLISDRAVAAFRESHLVGLSGYEPVEAIKVRGRGTPPQYHRVSVEKGGLAVDEDKSVVKRSEPITCDYCRGTGVDAVLGFVLEKEGWRGEDIFIPRGLSGTIVAGERFKQIVADYGLTNVRFTPTESWEWASLAKFR